MHLVGSQKQFFLKQFDKDMMHQIHILTLSVRDHLSSHGMALGFSRLGYPVPGVSHIQNSFYSLHSNNKKHKKHNKHKIQANKQHYNSYMHSVGRRRLLNLQVSHVYHLAGAARVYFIEVNFPCSGRPISGRIQGEERNKCLYP